MTDQLPAVTRRGLGHAVVFCWSVNHKGRLAHQAIPLSPPHWGKRRVTCHALTGRFFLVCFKSRASIRRELRHLVGDQAVDPPAQQAFGGVGVVDGVGEHAQAFVVQALQQGGVDQGVV